jgi:ubiquitin C-terminal hydrolase
MIYANQNNNNKSIISSNNNIQNIINPAQIQTISIEKDFRLNYANVQPTLIGLSDTGKICYMNSVLQCFNHIDVFIFNILNQSERIKENNDIIFSKVYLEFIEELLKIKNSSMTYKSFDPYHIRNAIIEDNSFKNTDPDDIADFIEFFLTKLHKELNYNNNINNYNNIDINNINMNENDKSKIFQNIYNYYNNNEKSLIVDLFFGYNEVTYKCLVCNKTYYNYEIFKCLKTG